jgi:carbon-monoxide dehydrogenase medium subunit
MSIPTVSETVPAIAFPQSVDEALALLEAHPGETRLLAGATWFMRAGSRGEKLPAMFVSLEQVAGFDAIVQRDNGWTIGPMTTHTALGGQFGSSGPFGALGQAGNDSANPGVRRLATIGGNLATADFAAADLVPALLALDASVNLATREGTDTIPVEDFLPGRAARNDPFVITGIEIDNHGGCSAHIRLTMRRAGEYPVAIASVSAKLSRGRRIEAVRIAIGSVEGVARRWRELEIALSGQTLDLAEIEAAARANLEVFTPRDGTDAPSWYRLEVVPHLVRMAFADIDKQIGR